MFFGFAGVFQLADRGRHAVGVDQVMIALHGVARLVVEPRPLDTALEQVLAAPLVQRVGKDVVELVARIGLLFVARRAAKSAVDSVPSRTRIASAGVPGW